MPSKRQGRLLKFQAPSKVLTLGVEKFSGEGGRSVKTFAKYPDDSLAEVKLSGHRIGRTNFRGARCKKSHLPGTYGPSNSIDKVAGELPKFYAPSKVLTLGPEKFSREGRA